MIPYVIWGEKENETREIHSLEELNQLTEELTTEAKADGHPMTIELNVNEESQLMIVLGLDISHVFYYSSLQRPRGVSGAGPWDNDEHIVFYYRGHYSGLQKKFWVPIAYAIEALHQYYQTGRRPDNINWWADRIIEAK